MTQSPPPFHDDWPALAEQAEALLEGRLRGDPAHVAAGKLDAAGAEARARRMRALAGIWRAVVRREPLPDPEIGAADWAAASEIRDDLAETARIARERAAETGSEPARLTALRIAALAFHHQPNPCFPFDVPNIVLIHGINQAARARQGEALANAAGDHVDRSAARAAMPGAGNVPPAPGMGALL